MYFEDVDLAERLGRRGWLHVYAPSAVVVHEGGHATRREPHRMQRVHHTSALRYLVRPVPAAPAGAAAGARCGPGSAPGCWSPTSAAGSAAGRAASSAGADDLPAPRPRPRDEGLTCGTR